MTPVGFHDELRFADLVMRFAYPAETFAVSCERLASAIKEDAKVLGVPCEMTPMRVVYAYRHHPSLAQERGTRRVLVIDHDKRTAQEVLADFTAACEARVYFREMTERIKRRNAGLREED